MKDYKKILEGVVNIINTAEKSDIGFANICTYIGENCPELKESEDERIMGNIIATIHLYYGEPLEDEAKEMIAWLEKQGEQKIKTPEESLGIDSDTYNKIVDECIYGEQKPTDNVEQKFHEGEWIIHQGTENIYQVVARIDNQYQLKYGDNYTIQKCADVDRCARLWDITKDAKDGDVLAWDDSKCIALFKNIYDEDSFNSYGFVGCCTGTFESRQSYHDIEGSHPATKEQRDLLFHKMHEAGYELDAEKKELIKIEQKPAAWSKEDERNLQGIIDEIEVSKNNAPDYDVATYNMFLSWLKSLKERYTWKPSEEQMNTLEYYMHTLVCNEHKEVLFGLYADLKKLMEK